MYPMTIAEMRSKCKNALGRAPRDVLVVAVVLLASSLSFGLGVLTGQEGWGSAGPVIEATPEVSKELSGEVVASRNGTRYYFPWCSGVERIAEENKIIFASKEAAEARGYTPAANCSGL